MADYQQRAEWIMEPTRPNNGGPWARTGAQWQRDVSRVAAAIPQIEREAMLRLLSQLDADFGNYPDSKYAVIKRYREAIERGEPTPQDRLAQGFREAKAR